MRAQTKRNKVRNVAVSTLCALLLAACGASPESMVTSAKEYIAKNDRNAATIQLKNALQKNPEIGEARFLLGKLYFEQADYPGAEKELTRALDAGYSADEVVPILAKALLASGQGDKIDSLLTSRQLKQPEARAALLTTQGLDLLGRGKREEGAAALNAALKESPGYALARVGQQYDLKNVIDLARYLIPTPPVPLQWRRRDPWRLPDELR